MTHRVWVLLGFAGVIAVVAYVATRRPDTAPDPFPSPSPKPQDPPRAAELGELPVSDRQRFYDDLLDDEPAALFATWKELVADKDGFKAYLAGEALVHRLQTLGDGAGTAAAYQEISRYVLDPTSPDERRAALVRFAGETATPPALRILLDAVDAESARSIRDTTLDALAHVGDHHWGDRFHPELSPALEARWRAAEEPAVLYALAASLADVGAPSGVDLLVDAALAAGPKIDDVRSSTSERVVAASTALGQVTNSDAVSAFASRMNRRGPEDAELLLSGDALASIGRPEAAEILLAWARDAGDEHAETAERWFAALNEDAAGQVAESIVKDPTFRSEKVRKAVQSLEGEVAVLPPK